MYDNNLQYVGGTIQTLSEKLDEGKILKYCYPEIDYTNFDPLMFSMNALVLYCILLFSLTGIV